MSLTSQEREQLLTMARDAVVRSVHHQELPSIDSQALTETLQQVGASFVTLTKRGELRGCIGSLEGRRPLAEDVRDNAISAAFHDPRFPPVTPDELQDLRVEVSVLSTPQPLAYDGADDLMSKLRPGVDGVVIESGWKRATFLPQVWEKIPDPKQFLEFLCRKAHLPADAYRQPGLKVYTYQVEKFKEGK